MKYQSFTSPRCKIFVEMDKTLKINREKCITCKGRLLCGLPACPILEQVKVQRLKKEKLKKNFQGPAPSLFVSWHDYPNVNVGFLSLPFHTENSKIYDDPAKWYGLGFPEIIEYRSNLVRSMEKCNVRGKRKLTQNLEEVSASEIPVEVEIELKSKPKFQVVFSAIAQPMGPFGKLKNFKITENPKIPKKVDRILGDELKAADSLNLLYKKGFDVYYLERIFSAGILGNERKLVPTRWSITAVDNILSNRMIDEIKNFKVLENFKVFSNSYLGNHFEILLMSEKWEYEQLEAWVPNTFWTLGLSEIKLIGEHETYFGRSDYAIREGGGYYAVRFAVCELLKSMRKQAAVLVFRETSEDYSLSVGVWECRENIRNAREVSEFESLEEALNDVEGRLRIPIKEWRKKSIILNQEKLDYWI